MNATESIQALIDQRKQCIARNIKCLSNKKEKNNPPSGFDERVANQQKDNIR